MNKKKEKGRFQKFIEIFLAIVLGIMTILTFYQVVMRYVLNNAPSWSEEVVRFLFVWSSFIAAAVGVKEGSHLGVDALTRMFPASVNKVLKIISFILISIFGGVLIYAGIPVVTMTHSQLSPAVAIPMSYIYISVPVMGVLLIGYSVIEIIKIIKSKEEKNC